MAKSKNVKQTALSVQTKKVDASDIVEDEFGNYRIRAAWLNGKFVARAFPRLETGAQGLIAEAIGSSENDAIWELKMILGQRDVERTRARRWDQSAELSVPSKDEYIEALLQIRLSLQQRSMLKADAIAGQKGLTTTELMRAAGYKSQETALKVLGKAGSLVAHFLGVELTSNHRKAHVNSMRVLANCEQEEPDSPTVWILHEELRNAVKSAL